MSQLTGVHILERLMQERKLTQEQLGLLLGCTKGRVSQIIREEKPSNEALLRTSEVLHVNLMELVDGEGRWLRFDV